VKPDALLPARGELSPVSLALPDDLSFDEWQDYGARLRHVAESVMWWLGDWWLHGERKYGESASHAAPTGYALATLQEASRVSERIEKPRRLGDLSWSHHQTVASLHPSEQDTLLAKASGSGWSTRELRQAVRLFKHALKTGTAGEDGPDPIDDLSTTPEVFSAIVIDPPWRYDNIVTRNAAAKQYDTMSQDELLAIDLPSADNSHLYLWVTNNFFEDGFELLRHWGFTYKTCLTWCKPQIGMGNYFRSTTEHVLFGVKGKLPTLRNNVPTHFVADRTIHSAKPECFYDMVESCSPGPYLEMFARRRRFGWHVWGNEA